MKVWGYVVFAGILFGAIFKLIFMGKEFGMSEVKARANLKAVKQQQKSTDAMIEGLKKEDEIRNKKPDSKRSNRFTRQ